MIVLLHPSDKTLPEELRVLGFPTRFLFHPKGEGIMCHSRQAEALPSCRCTSDPGDGGGFGLHLGGHSCFGF